VLTTVQWCLRQPASHQKYLNLQTHKHCNMRSKCWKDLLQQLSSSRQSSAAMHALHA
jgi:hypothetical protein